MAPIFFKMAPYHSACKIGLSHSIEFSWPIWMTSVTFWLFQNSWHELSRICNHWKLRRWRQPLQMVDIINVKDGICRRRELSLPILTHPTCWVAFSPYVFLNVFANKKENKKVFVKYKQIYAYYQCYLHLCHSLMIYDETY